MSTLHDTDVLAVPGPKPSDRILSVTDLRIAFSCIAEEHLEELFDLIYQGVQDLQGK